MLNASHCIMSDPPSSTSSGQPVDIEVLRSAKYGTYIHKYKQRDLILYALGLGCTKKDLHLVYEQHKNFTPLPTYAIIAAHPSLGLIPLEKCIPGFSRVKALHGEQFLQLLGPLPPKANLVTRPQLLDVQDKGKGKGVVVVVRTITTDSLTGRDLAVQEFVAFGLGCGGFGSPWAAAPRLPAATAENAPPARPPDAEVTEVTSADQAVLYRLSGDYNPLHIDPAVAKRVGFQEPILHGLCSLGISVKLVVNAMAGGDHSRLRSVKVRFSKHVLPGETLRVVMWREGAADARGLTKIIFETFAVERGAKVISNAAVELSECGWGQEAGSKGKVGGAPQSKL